MNEAAKNPMPSQQYLPPEHVTPISHAPEHPPLHRLPPNPFHDEETRPADHFLPQH